MYAYGIPETPMRSQIVTTSPITWKQLERLNFKAVSNTFQSSHLNPISSEKQQPMNFKAVLEKYRQHSYNEKDKGERFERLMKAYLLTDPKYAPKLKKVWLWSEFPGKDDFRRLG